MFPISRDQIAKIHLLVLITHLLLTSKHFSLEGLSSNRVSLYVQFPSIHIQIWTDLLNASFAHMHFEG